MSKIKPITFDPSNAFVSPHGITRDQFNGMQQKLYACRDEMLKEDLSLWTSGEDVSEAKQPLDAGFHEMPERILDDYQADRDNSELGRILNTAKRLGSLVDKIVVLGIGGSYMGTRAVMETCCSPYHNEMTRAQRGGRPRMYFEGNNVDNDWAQALLQFLESDSQGDGPEGHWGIIVISKSGGTLETAASLRIFREALQAKVGEDRLAEFIVPVTGESGKLSDLSTEIGCVDRFLVPNGIGGRFSVFSSVGLLPAAVLGIDVVRMLEAAAAMNSHFQTAELGKNAVMDYVAVNHLLEVEQGVNIRVLSVWSKSLESAGFWYDQLLAESLGKHGKGALPLTCLNSRDLHSRAQQHQEGARDKVMNNVIVGSWRTDPLAIGESKWDQDQLNDLADKTLPVIMQAAINGTNLAYKEDGRPTTDIHLPAADEAALGQLFQMLMLATVLEGRLLGVNPYGQPGVEKYKKYMNQLLREPVTAC
ncbi:glucose-6-phosphate isomerase [bacterium]|nr:glucose-6-phosphate isomerase [bacterium]